MKVLNYGLKKEFADRYNIEDMLKKILQQLDRKGI